MGKFAAQREFMKASRANILSLRVDTPFWFLRRPPVGAQIPSDLRRVFPDAQVWLSANAGRLIASNNLPGLTIAIAWGTPEACLGRSWRAKRSTRGVSGRITGVTITASVMGSAGGQSTQISDSKPSTRPA